MHHMIGAAMVLGFLIVSRIWAGARPTPSRNSGRFLAPALPNRQRSQLTVYGSISISRDVMRAGSITVVGGTMHLGDANAEAGGGIHATSEDVIFRAGTRLKVEGAFGHIGFAKRRRSLTLFPDSILDLSEQALIVDGGWLQLDGICRFGLIDQDEAMLVTFVSVNQGWGRAMLGDAFTVELSEQMQEAYARNPDDVIDGVVVVDAVVLHKTIREGQLWEQRIHNPLGMFILSAKLGAKVADGGGVRLYFQSMP